MIKQIKKRSGSVLPFDAKKITEAIWKAAEAVDGKDRERAEFLAAEVVHHLEGKFQEDLPSVEDVQDEVEKVLIEFGHAKTAKAFILYRQKRKEMREARERLGINEETKISLNALKILEERYLCKDENGKVIETPSQLFRRVAHNISLADQRYGQDAKKSEEEFFGLMTAFDFLPNSPTLMNAGTSIQQLSACFVLPIEDDIPQIFDSVKNTAIIHKTGGGCIKKCSRVFSTFCGSERIERLYEYFENEANHSTEGEAVYLDVSQENLKVPSFQSSSGRMTFQPVEKIWKYLLPSEKTFKIKCEGGYTAETSEWHPFFTFDQGEVREKRADELKNGDYLLISNPSIQEKWPFSEKWRAGELIVDEEMAWLSGLFSTDGSIDETKQGLRVRFFSSETEIVDKTLRILEEKTGIRYAVSVDERSLHPVTRIAVYNKKMTEALKILNRNLVGRKETLVRVPAQIFKSRIPIIGAYLAGVMDGDDYVAEKKKQIEITSASNEFIEDLSSLFYLLGIKSRCRERKDKRNAEWLMLYELSISDRLSLKRFSELVLPYLALTRKKERLANHLNGEHSSLSTPLDFSVIEPYLEEAGVKTKSTDIWRRSIVIGNNKFFLARWKEKGKISLVKSEALITALLESNISPSSKEKLRKLRYVLPNLIPIKSVMRNNPGRTEEFYDFTVNETNNYLAGNRGLSIIHNTGFSFSRLRPKGDLVGTTGGIASGPISFMKVFDCATEQIKQGGKRRGANMGILRVDHPDILEFIGAKEKNTEINNFNLSVAITDAFMEAVEKNEDYDLINPRGKRVVGRLNAKHVFNLISMMAWKNGEPGVVFIDRMNQFNPTPKLGPIESTNPCGEQPLLPYESCNLGSLNLVNFINAHKQIDWDRLKACVHRCAHFLDNVIDMNKYPLPEIKKLTEGNRKIGLGVMGWADALIKMELQYNNPEAVKLADEVMCFINLEAMKASAELAKKRGTFPNFKDSIYDTDKTEDRMRNATRTTIAPTGTISILSSCSSGIEPLFAISYLRKTPQFELLEVNPLFEEVAKEEGFYSEELMRKIAGLGSIKHVEEIPEKWKRIFVTAMDLTPEDHVRMQAAFQKHTNNAVSKTVNFPNSATVEEVAEVYRLAYKLGCKGTTIYRDGSRDVQVLNVVKEQFKEEPKAEKKIEKKPVTVASDFAGGCTTCHV